MIPGLYPAELVEAVVIVAILTVLAFWRHRANIVRLVHGNERRLWGGNKEKIAIKYMNTEVWRYVKGMYSRCRELGTCTCTCT